MLGKDDYRGLRSLLEARGEGAVAETVAGWLRDKQARPTDFQLRPLFEALVPDGRELLEEWRSGGLSGGTYRALQEGGAGAVKSSAFTGTVGQVVADRVLEYSQLEEFIFSREVDEYTSSEIGMEAVNNVTEIGDEAAVVEEADDYQYAGVGEDWIHLPPAKKRGFKIGLTWEAVFQNKNGLLMRRAGDGGKWAGLNKEKRIIDAICDENGGAVSAALGGHRYHWRGTSYATFQTSAASAPYYANVATSNALVDWTDIQAAELVFKAIKDPYTNEGIGITPTVLACVPTLAYAARYIMASTGTAIQAGGFATTGNLVQTQTRAPVGTYRILSSQLLADRMATDTDWYLGDLKRAVGYKVIRPLQVEQAPAGHADLYNRDLVALWKVSEFGAAFVQEPRAIVESRA